MNGYRSRSPRVAIVSDALVQRGGAERVVEAIADAFPDAPIFALLYSAERGPASLEARVRTSWLQRVPGAARRHRAFFPLYRSAIESFALGDFDAIVSSHHTVAKGILRSAEQVHVCYCHTPMRALWERSNEELATLPGFARVPAAALLSSMRVWDYATAARVDEFLANSRVTQRRIERHYGRASTVLSPPIDVERFTLGQRSFAESDYYLVAARDVPYKRVDLAVAAARAAGRRLIVAGGAHESARGVPGVELVGVVDDARLIDLMRGARALLFPQLEDFGMTPLEMNACGRPTIALAAGGALETVIDGATGVLVDEQNVEAFVAGIRRFEGLAFNPLRLREHAETFSRAAFAARLRSMVMETWERRVADDFGASRVASGPAISSYAR